ncbi:hypothetical protein V8C86DRAFT_3207629 [Haematococcus lacustris]
MWSNNKLTSTKGPAMDQFVVRGISAADAAANWHRELLIHDEQRFQMSLDRQAAVIEKRLLGRPRKLSNFGPYPGRNPATSPSTPPALSRAGKAHENWWHPGRIQPILRAVPACGGYSPAVKHLKLVQPDLYSKLDESTRLVDDMNMRATLLVFAKGVPPELFYSMDETFVFFAPMAGSTTLAEQGSKQVYAAASEQKKHS